MYKVGDIVRYNKPWRIAERGKILTKLKIIDDVEFNCVGENIYIISHNKLEDNDLVQECKIIGLIDRKE